MRKKNGRGRDLVITGARDGSVASFSLRPSPLITTVNRIVQVSYDKGIALHTVYLTNDQGQRFEYHYMTDYCFTQTPILAGC